MGSWDQGVAKVMRGRPNLGLSELSARGFQEISPINWVTPGIPISGLVGK